MVSLAFLKVEIMSVTPKTTPKTYSEDLRRLQSGRVSPPAGKTPVAESRLRDVNNKLLQK